MVQDSERKDPAATMRRINRAWLGGQVEDLAPMVHPEVVLVVPGFTTRIQGREHFLASFWIAVWRTMLDVAENAA